MMTKRQATWLGISVIILLVIVLAVYRLSNNEPEPEDVDEAHVLIESIETVNKLTVVADQGFEIERVDDQWQVNGRDEDTHQAYVEEALNRLGQWQGEAVDVMKKDVGLDFPMLALKIDKSDSELKVSIGQLNQSETDYYVHDSATDQIYLVERSLIESFPYYQEAFLDQTLLSDLDQITELEISNGTEMIRLTNQNPFSDQESLANLTGWYINEPFNYTHFTSYSVTEQLVQLLNQLSFESTTTLSKEDEELGLMETDFTVQFSDGSNEKNLLIGKPATPTSYYGAFVEDTEVFTLSNEVVRIFSTPSDAFHDGFVKVVALDTLRELSVNKDGETYALHVSKEDEAVSFESDGESLNPEEVRHAYTNLAGITVTGVVSQEDLAETNPEITIMYQIETENGSDEVEVKFVDYDPEHYVVFINGVHDFLVEKTTTNNVVDAMNQLLNVSE